MARAESFSRSFSLAVVSFPKEFLPGTAMVLKALFPLFPPLAGVGWGLWLYWLWKSGRDRALKHFFVSMVLVFAALLALVSAVSKAGGDLGVSEENVLDLAAAYLLGLAASWFYGSGLRLLGFPVLGWAWFLAGLLFPAGALVQYGLRALIAAYFFSGRRLVVVRREDAPQAEPEPGVDEGDSRVGEGQPEEHR